MSPWFILAALAGSLGGGFLIYIALAAGGTDIQLGFGGLLVVSGLVSMGLGEMSEHLQTIARKAGRPDAAE
jgi:hypothetical protein